MMQIPGAPGDADERGLHSVYTLYTQCTHSVHTDDLANFRTILTRYHKAVPLEYDDA